MCTRILPLTRHLYCLSYLNTNITESLRSKLGDEWDEFKRGFWAAYRAVSPEQFDRLWIALEERFPNARAYLGGLNKIRDQWAWFAVS